MAAGRLTLAGSHALFLMDDSNLPGGETPDERELFTESPPEQAGDNSPLGIKHLLVWTALCAVYLAVARWFASSNEHVSMDHRWQTSVVMNSLSNGALFAVPLMWWTRRHNKTRFPKHPGEWVW